MVILLSGASHTGKTRLAQQLMEHLHIPYLSIDHLKMGLIRSGQTTLTPTDDQQLTDYLWSIRSTANVIEQRLDNSWCTLEQLLDDNRFYLENCTRQGCSIAFIQDEYPSFEQFCTLLDL